MKRMVPIIIVLTSVLSMTLMVACGSGLDYSLPDDPIRFSTTTFVDSSNEEGEYAAIEYEDRAYIPFGTLKGTLGNGNRSRAKRPRPPANGSPGIGGR